MKFILLFHGGKVPEALQEQSIKDRLAWMSELRDSGHLLDGSPLRPEGVTIVNDVSSDFVHVDDSVNGYAIIEADSIATAVELSRTAPQLYEKYGAAKVEIRPFQPLK